MEYKSISKPVTRKYNKLIVGSYLLIIITFFFSCEDFLEVETPDYKLDSKIVFSNDQTAQTALQGIFNQLFNAGFSNGGSQSISYLAALSADTYSLTTTTQDLVEFQQNQISPDNNHNLLLWSGAYNIIYQANSLLNGVENNNALTEEVINEIEGSSKFIRGLTYFYLVNLYGEVPLILGTDYRQNALASRASTDVIYARILEDLESSAELLDDDYFEGERTQLNKFSAFALLARIHLFLENWEQAENYSSQVIEASSYYEILDDPNQVFLANSNEAIWQISPIGWGNSFTHTRDGNLLIKTPTSNTPVELSETFLNTFNDVQDKRYVNWIGAFVQENDTLYYPHKYKIQYDASGGTITEYSMVLRLAEQYLIRAEARARMGNLSGALEDVNKIKSRAGIPAIEESQDDLTESELVEEILLERRRELFSEWGHRWFDLKRLKKSEILRNKENSNWTTSSNFFPIPSDERIKNPNLTQNAGY